MTENNNNKNNLKVHIEQRTVQTQQKREDMRNSCTVPNEFAENLLLYYFQWT